jgi:hypothetical protein
MFITRESTIRDSAPPPNLPSIEVLGVDFLGPTALATLISAVEMGIVIACFMRFLARSDKEPLHIKLLVFFLTFVSLCVSSSFRLSSLSLSLCSYTPGRPTRFQTIATSAAWWKIFVQDFGNWVRFFFLVNNFRSSSPLTSLLLFFFFLHIPLVTSRQLQYLPGHRKFILLWCAALYFLFACHFEPTRPCTYLDNGLGRSGSAISYQALLARGCFVLLSNATLSACLLPQFVKYRWFVAVSVHAFHVINRRENDCYCAMSRCLSS